MKTAVLTTMLLVGLIAAAAPGLKPRRPSALLNHSVPVFEGKTLSGKQIGPGYFRGRVTLLNFMYLGCPPCMAEVPMLHRLQAQVADPAFQVLAIAPHTAGQLRHFNSADNSPQSGIRRYFKVEPIRYELLPECLVAHSTGNTFGPECSAISDKFGVQGYPLSLLIDRHGVVRYVYEGFAMDTVPQRRIAKEMEQNIRKLLAQK